MTLLQFPKKAAHTSVLLSNHLFLNEAIMKMENVFGEYLRKKEGMGKYLLLRNEIQRPVPVKVLIVNI